MELQIDEWLRDNDQKLLKASKYSDKDNWDAYRHDHFRQVRAHSELKGLEFNLTIDDFVYPDVCPILGIKITRKLGMSNNPTVDRVDNTKGYTKDNVCIISHKANRLKNSNSIETLKSILNYIQTNQ